MNGFYCPVSCKKFKKQKTGPKCLKFDTALEVVCLGAMSAVKRCEQCRAED